MQEKTYEKTIWEDGKTLITANLLNKVEDKLVDLDSNVKTIDSQIKEKANITTTNDIQQQVNNLVLGAVGDGNNAEVVQARGVFNVLNDRLNSDSKIVSDLDSIIRTKSRNILDVNTLIQDKWIKNWGTVTSSNFMYDSTGKVLTPLYTVSEGEIYGSTDNKGFVYIIFNTDGSSNTILVDSAVTKITIPTGCNRICFGFASESLVPRGIMKLDSVDETPVYEEYGYQISIIDKTDFNLALNEVSSKINSNNVIDKDKLLTDTHIKTWGTCTTDTYSVAKTGFYTTLPITVNNGDIYKVIFKGGRKASQFGYVTFNDNNNSVRISDNVNNEVIIQEGETQIVFALGTQSQMAIIKCNSLNEYPKYEQFGIKDKYILNPNLDCRPCDYTGDEIIMLGKGVIIGDSYVQGGYDYKIDSSTTGYFSDKLLNFPQNLKRMTGLDVINKGDGGKTSINWWNAHQNDDLSGNKFAIISLGINDTLKQSDGWNTDSDTGITNIVNKLREENGNDIPIFISTIPNEYSYSNVTYTVTNEKIRTISNTLNLYLVDLEKYNNIMFGLDILGGHPTSYGYYNIAKHWKSYISYLIALNSNNFRKLQFVGTNYSYN